MKEEQLGRFVFRNRVGVFPLGGDSLALGAFATVRPRMKVCDLGTGSGLLLLLLAEREASVSLVGVELEEEAVSQARENMQLNGLNATILHEDLKETSLQTGTFDLVVSNPPYFDVNSGKVANGARSEVYCTLDDVCHTAARLLKNGGRFAIVYRPERLVALFAQMRQYGIEPKRMKLLSHSPSHAPSAVLVEGVRQGNVGLTIEV